MTERYEVNGIDLSTVVHSIQVIDGFMGVPRPMNNTLKVPGRWGGLATAPYFDERTITLGVVLRGSSRPDYLANAKEFMSLIVNNGRVFTLTRVHNTTSGEERVDAAARYVGGLDAIEPITPNSGRATVEISLLDGFWLSQQFIDSNTVSDALFGVEVPGELETPFVEVTFAGGSGAQRLTNPESGAYVEWSGDTATHPVVINVPEFTVTQNASVALTNFTYDNANGERYWFMLGPGSTQLQRTGNGTVRVRYKGAFI